MPKRLGTTALSSWGKSLLLLVCWVFYVERLFDFCQVLFLHLLWWLNLYSFILLIRYMSLISVCWTNLAFLDQISPSHGVWSFLCFVGIGLLVFSWGFLYLCSYWDIGSIVFFSFVVFFWYWCQIQWVGRSSLLCFANSSFPLMDNPSCLHLWRIHFDIWQN